MYVEPTETKVATRQNLQACKTLLMEKMDGKSLTIREIRTICLEEQTFFLGTALDALRELQNDGQIERMYSRYGKRKLQVCYRKTKVPSPKPKNLHYVRKEVENQVRQALEAFGTLSTAEIAGLLRLSKSYVLDALRSMASGENPVRKIFPTDDKRVSRYTLDPEAPETSREDKILALLKEKKGLTTVETASLIGKSRVHTSRLLRALVDDGKADRIAKCSTSPSCFYVLKTPPTSLPALEKIKHKPRRGCRAADLKAFEKQTLTLLGQQPLRAEEISTRTGYCTAYVRSACQGLAKKGKIKIIAMRRKTSKGWYNLYAIKHAERPDVLVTRKRKGPISEKQIVPLAILKQQPLPLGRSAKMSLLEETIVLALTEKPTTPIGLYNRFPKGIWKDVWAAVDSLLAAGKIEKINGELDAEPLFTIAPRDKSEPTKTAKAVKTVTVVGTAPLAADKATLKCMLLLAIRSEGPISLGALANRFSRQTYGEIWSALEALIEKGRVTKTRGPKKVGRHPETFYTALEEAVAPATEEIKPTEAPEEAKLKTKPGTLKDAVRKDYAGQAMTFTDLAWKFRKESPTALLAAINEMEAEGSLEKVKDGAPGAKEVLLYIRKRAMAPTLTPEKTRLLELIDARFKEIEESMKEIVAAVVDNTLAN